MSRTVRLAVLGLVALAAAAPAAHAQRTAYIGYVYPAGGQQGTTFQIRLGGQNLDGVDAVLVSGTGVQAKVTEYFRKLGNQEMTLMREQLAELRPRTRRPPWKKPPPKQTPTKKTPTKQAAPKQATTKQATTMQVITMQAPLKQAGPKQTPTKQTPTRRAPPKQTPPKDKETLAVIAKIDRRMAEHVQNPANASISSLVFVEVTIAPDAPPGRRELRLATSRGVTNPLVFHVGQVPEFSRKPMKTATVQVLGKEEGALRKRPHEEEEVLVTVPCTANGQIASGEVNRYRFEARKGQRLLVSLEGRLLKPYIADAVPGWFQPVLTLHDANGKEVAFDDDYRFKPDPVLFFEVPRDGAYVLDVIDAIYRGREDFVYRLTIGELPFVTSIFPLGGPAGKPPKFEMTGWNLDKAVLMPPPKDAGPGIHRLAATRDGVVSNDLPVALDTLPEAFDKEPNNDRASAQKVTLPIIINGRIDRPGDWDVFQVAGRAGQTLVAEVSARRLESPLDSILKVTDAGGRLLAVNDDHEDPAAGVNTHHADSYLMVKLPADGTYCVHLGDVAHSGGREFAYRLRLSRPQPDVALFVVPSAIALRARGSASVNVQVVRKDGFTGPVSVGLKDPPAGFALKGGSIPPDKPAGRLTLSTSLKATKQLVDLRFEGTAKTEQGDVTRLALAAEDRMQAFLWRHLVPAENFKVLVYNPSYTPPARRVPRAPPKPSAETKPPAEAKNPPQTKTPAAKPTFTKGQVTGRLRQLKSLFEEGLLTDDFYARKVAECEAAR